MRLFWNLAKPRRGDDIILSLSSRCNLRCKYCPWWIGRSKFPVLEESSLEEWKEFISLYPNKIKRIQLCGGEPSGTVYMAEFTNWLIDRGIFVLIYTNLMKPEEFLKIKKSYRVLIYATYHHGDDLVRFDKAYRLIKNSNRVDVVEIDEPLLPYSTRKPFITPQELLDQRTLHFAPDSPKTRAIYCGCEPWY